jgi:hypothetical protein
MSEPFYEYLGKKVGWALVYERKILAFDKNGKKCWLIDRMPRVGEIHLGYSESEPEWWDGTSLNFKGPIDFIKCSSLDNLGPLGDNNPLELGHYLTVVPIND